MPTLLREMAQRSRIPSISVRGVITEQVCRVYGVDACAPNGCPSLTINREAKLGEILATGWHYASEAIAAGRRLRVVLTMPALSGNESIRTDAQWHLLEILFVDIAGKRVKVAVPRPPGCLAMVVELGGVEAVEARA